MAQVVPGPGFTAIGPPCRCGSKLFVFLLDRSNSPTDFVRAYLSSDQGATWAEVDAGNAPQVADDGATAANFSLQDANAQPTAHLFITPAGAFDLAYIPFDFVTETWGSVVTGGPEIDPITNVDTVGGRSQGFVHRPGADDLIFHYRYPDGGGVDYYTWYTSFDLGTLTWAAAPVQVSDYLGGVDANLGPAAVLGDSDWIHFFAVNLAGEGASSGLYGSTLNGAVLSAWAGLRVAPGAPVNSDFQPARYDPGAGIGIVVLLYNVASGDVQYLDWTSADPLIAAVPTTIAADANSLPLSAWQDDTLAYLLWQSGTTADTELQTWDGTTLTAAAVILLVPGYSGALGTGLYNDGSGDYGIVSFAAGSTVDYLQSGVAAGSCGVVPPAAAVPPPQKGGSPQQIKLLCPNYYDWCLDNYKDFYSQFHPDGRPCIPECYREREPWILIPKEGREFHQQFIAALPAAEQSNTLIGSFLIPTGYDGLAWGLLSIFTGSGFVPGSGDIIFRVQLQQHYVRNLGNMNFPLGSLGGGYFPLPEHQPLQSNQVVSLYAYLGSGALGRLDPAGKIIMGLEGWYYPQGYWKQELYAS